MSRWAIGDLQGCLSSFQLLLEELAFDPRQDQLWLTGDLVNRGPDSLGVLRLISRLGDAAITVLGNHDLHLLAVSYGHGRLKARDSLDQLLVASDWPQLRDWLQQQPLLHSDGSDVLVHAGVPPEWDLATARAQAEATAAVLRARLDAFFASMYGNQPSLWREAGSAVDRQRYTVNALTRMRYCDAEGRLDFSQKGDIASTGGSLLPWFQHPARQLEPGLRVLFGHWSTLAQLRWPAHKVVGLDSGCVWGGRLTALNLDSDEMISVAAVETPAAF